jgi:DNA-binding CsgD family transcriptional regulator
MGYTQPEFEARVDRVRQMWHGINNALKDFEQRAAKEPMAGAEEALRKVAYESNLYRVTHKRLFRLDLKRRQEWWGRVPLPPDPNRRALFIDGVLLYRLFESVWEAYSDGIERPDLRGENLARAMCEIYVEAKLTEPWLLSSVTEIVSKQLPGHRWEEAFAEQLTGYFLTQLSTTPRYRLGRALREAGQPEEVLRQELPAASLAAWAERGPEEFVLKALRNRIAENMARHVSGTPGESRRANDIAALADFAERERVLKQGREAGLAPREYEIFKLFVENPGIKYREIANRLGVSVGTVGKTKSRIARALNQAG